MRTSHRAIRNRVLAVRDKITDEEFFSSKAYNAYIADIAEAATKRYRKPLKVQVVADHEDSTLAYTDNERIFINACNEITWSMPTRYLRSLSIEGLNAHENGHNLFTDSRIWHSFYRKLEQGKFYPCSPSGLTSEQKRFADEICAAMLDPSDRIPAQAIQSTAKTLSNILEDGYVDARYSYEFPGTPARGIALNNLRIAERAADIETMLEQQYFEHNIVLNLLIQYVNAGEVNNLSGYSGEILDKLTQYIPVVDECLMDEDARERCKAASYILIDLWPMLQKSFDTLRDQAIPPSSGMSQPGDAESSVENMLDSQLPQRAPNFTVKTTPVPSQGSYVPDPSQADFVRNEIAQVLSEETARIQAHLTSEITGDSTGAVSYDHAYGGFGYQNAASDMERILTEVATKRVLTEVEEELSEELQREANQISYGNAHQNVDVTVHRMSQVPAELVDAYRQVSPELLALSKRLQRSVSAVLRDKRQGGKQNGLLIGKRLNQHALYREDGRIFSNSRLPTEPINLAVGLLVDESGSMAGSDRITKARATAIVVQDFCEKLGIPLSVVGHTAFNSHVELFSYADFNSVDRNDRYRLMDMSARHCNRDGAALRYVAERLHRYPADAKLLIIISDGQPNDEGYSGTAAEADLRGIKQEYTRKGVQIFAAAIGDDREKLERIYGSGFLDISNLQQLPVTLTNLIARNLPK